MPLAPLPANNTDRAWLRYTSVGVGHEIVFRFPSSTTQANIITACTAFANSIKSGMQSTDSFTGLRHQDSGSIVSFPLAWTAIVGTGSASTDVDNKAKFMSLTGRSLAGYRCKLTFFAPGTPDSAGYRSLGAGAFATAVAAMPTQPVAIDGQAVVWNAYVNYGYNSYWQKQFR